MTGKHATPWHKAIADRGTTYRDYWAERGW